MLAAVLFALPLSSVSAEPKWPAGVYRYVVIDQDVKDVLVEFGRNTRIPMRISEALAPKRMRGEFKAANAEQFFKDLCASYGLVWYFDGSLLHVSTENEVRTELIDLGRVPEKGFSERKLQDRLKTLNAADQRYPIKLAQDNLLSISGPPAYINMVRQTLSATVKAATPRPVAETPSSDDSRVRVFRGGS